MIPSDWHIHTVGQLFDVQLGKMLNKAAKEAQPQYKYLGNSDVRWGYFETNDLKRMHFSEKEKETLILASISSKRQNELKTDVSTLTSELNAEAKSWFNG